MRGSTTRSIGRSGPPGNPHGPGRGDLIGSLAVAARRGETPARHYTRPPRLHPHEGATNVSSLIESLVLENATKIVLLVMDGIGDLPHPEHGLKTPLEAAKTPNLDSLAP